MAPDATIVGYQWQEGRWTAKPALEFRGVSDRSDERPRRAAFDSGRLGPRQGLDRPIDSLFMSDGFLPGTVHCWVIRNDGRWA